MAASLITRSPSALTVPRPRLVRDPMVRASNKFLFDFSDPRCHPGGAITPGPVSAGTVFQSLDTAPVSAIVVGSGISVNADGSLYFNGTGAANQLRIGTAGQFNMAPSPYEYIATLTIKVPTTGYTTTNFWSPLASGADNNDAQLTLDMGSGGLTPRAAIGVPGASPSNLTTSSPAVTPGAVFQSGIRFDPGARLGLYRDGAIATEIVAGSVPSALVDGAAKFFRLQSAGKFTAYRVSLADLDASIATETTWGLAAADVLTASQHVAADYAFGRGTLPGAPKTAFA